MPISQTLQLAFQHYTAGQLQSAQILCEQVLQQQSNQLDALHLLGVIAAHRQQYETAIALFQKAISINNAVPEFYESLGTVFKKQGQFIQALNCLQQAIVLNPNHAQTYHQLGEIFAHLGKLVAATTCYQRAIQLNPNFAEAHNALGNILKTQGQLPMATKRTQDAGIHDNLAGVWHDNAEKFSKPFSPSADLIQLALQHHQRGEFAQAETLYRQILQTQPNHLTALHSLGVLAAQMQNDDAAFALFKQAIQINNQVPLVYQSLGNLLSNQHQFAEAAIYYQQALDLDPTDLDIYSRLGYVLRAQGKVAEAVTYYQQALQRQPSHVTIHNDLLFTINYAPHYRATEIYAEHLKFDRQHAAGLRSTKRPGPFLQPTKRLKIGYVSADLRKHSVGYFMEPILEHHDHAHFEIFVYSNNPRNDEVTERFRWYSDHWRECMQLSDAELAQQIRQDEIDILVDLSSHMRGNRLLVFARHPAPLQITYLGHPTTTGLQAMDYRLTDWQTDPAGFETLSCEKLLRLPHSFYCYRPPSATPPVGELPVLSRGYVTFGSFNALIKTNPLLLQWWAQILRAVPDSRLLLKTHALNSHLTKQELIERFAVWGIAEQRLTLLGWEAETSHHLARYDEMDIALDTFPYNGGTTTCKALWMGVPVITLTGDRSVARMGASILTSVGLAHWVANRPEEYISLAVTFSRQVPILQALRKELRGRMQHSPLLDAVSFTSQIEAIYREIWKQWCAEC